MSSGTALQRAHAYLEDARDPSIDTAARREALDATRSALLDARRARIEPELLLPIFKDICTAALSDSSYFVRSVAPQTVEDMCLREMKLFVPASTSFLVRSLHDDHVLVAKRAVRALTTLFRKLIGFIVNVGVSEDTFPEARLSAWLQMQTKAISLMHAQDEGLRKAATKFAETVVLAFSYSGGPGSPDHFTLDYVLKKGSTCQLLNPTALEEEGVRCVKAVAQLIHSSLDGTLTTIRPDGSSIIGFPPLSFMTAVSVMSNLIRRRRKLLQFTLPPLLLVVAAIAGTTRPPSPAFDSLPEGQKLSIISVLRFSILALRAYPHTRTGRAGSDINLATNDLSTYEKDQENKRREMASAKAVREKKQVSNAAPPLAVVGRGAGALPRSRERQPLPVFQRPPQMDSNQPWPRPPAKEAFAIAQALTRSMPHQEVVNFITTRLLLDIPPPATVPGAVRPRNPQTPSVPTEEPSHKRMRKSRFGTKDDDPSSQPSAAPRKVLAVRKVAPPVVPVRLSAEATGKLVTLCCRRLMKRESEATISGAGPLRVQLLARLLTSLARSETEIAKTFCDEACAFIAEGVEGRVEMTLAWLHSLLFEEQFAEFEPNPHGESKALITSSEEHDNKTEKVEAEEACISNIDANSTEIQESDALETVDSHPGVKSEDVNGVNPKEEMKVENHMEVDIARAVSEEQGAAKASHEQDVVHENVQEELEEEHYEPVIAGEGYERIFITLLHLLKEKSDISVEAFSKIVTDAPLLPLSVMEALSGLCRDASRTKLGLQVLRDIIVERCAEDRRNSLALLLEYTSDKDEVLRGPAIRLVANKIFVECNSEVAEVIQDHARAALKHAIDALSQPTPSPEDIDLLERSSLLLTALCGQKEELLVYIAKCYSESPAEGQTVLLHRAKDLAGHLGMSAKPILELIAGTILPAHREESDESPMSDGAEALALDTLRALLKKFGKPTPEIVEAACRRYETMKNTNFIIAVLPGLRKDALISHLSAIVETSVRSSTLGSDAQQAGISNGEKEEVKSTSGFREIVGQVLNAQSAALSSTELLVQLHKIEPSPAVSTAIRTCFEMKVVFKPDAIAQAIQQVVEMTVTPDLLMRTVHLARIFYPELEKFLTTSVMKRLIEKRVWTNDLLWEGFLRYCAETKEKALILLLNLPAPQLQDALEKQPVLTSVFKDLMSNPKNAKKVQIQAKHKKVITAAIKKRSKSKT